MTALPVVRSGRGALALLEEGRRLLAEAITAGDVKRLRDQAQAVQHYLRQQGFALEVIQDAAELKLRAERRLGELLAETVNHNGGRPRKRLHDATVLGNRLPRGGLQCNGSPRPYSIAAGVIALQSAGFSCMSTILPAHEIIKALPRKDLRSDGIAIGIFC